MERVQEEERQAKAARNRVTVAEVVVAAAKQSDETNNIVSHTPEHVGRRGASPADTRKERSKSVDSEKFVSPKRREPSATPEKEWN